MVPAVNTSLPSPYYKVLMGYSWNRGVEENQNTVSDHHKPISKTFSLTWLIVCRLP